MRIKLRPCNESGLKGRFRQPRPKAWETAPVEPGWTRPIPQAFDLG